LRYWIAIGLLFAATFASAAPLQIEPFKATYAVSYRGVRAGSITFELKREGDNRYVYQSTVAPSMLARVLVSSNATETSHFVVTDQGVQPLHWKLEDGQSNSEKDGELTFDTKAKRIQGTVEDKRVDLPLDQRVQDRMSIQMEVLRALAQGAEPGSIALIDDEKVKTYHYARGQTSQVKTPLGEFNAVLYESTRPGSKRISRMWHAPALGFIPIRAEQVRQGKVETVMQLVELAGRKH
jgi:hypothetical protein